MAKMRTAIMQQISEKLKTALVRGLWFFAGVAIVTFVGMLL